MADQPKALIEFYRQLALLLESELPLPASVRSLAPECGSRPFREALREVAAAVDSGVTLGEAMKRYPRYFPERYRTLIAAGEADGTLHETLHEIGMAAQADHRITVLFRDLLLYPSIVLLFLLAVVIGLFYIAVFPIRESVLSLFGEHERLPMLTECVFNIAAVIHTNIDFFLVAYAVLAVFLAWLLSRCLSSTRFLLWLLKRLPGFGSLFRELEDARICLLWSLLLKHRRPAPEIFDVLEASSESAAGRAMWRSIGERTAAGEAVASVLKQEPGLSPVLGISFEFLPEDRLGGELGRLAGFFLDRAGDRMRALSTVSEVLLTLFLSLLVLLTILSLFLPFVRGICVLG